MTYREKSLDYFGLPFLLFVIYFFIYAPPISNGVLKPPKRMGIFKPLGIVRVFKPPKIMEVSKLLESDYFSRVRRNRR